MTRNVDHWGTKMQFYGILKWKFNTTPPLKFHFSEGRDPKSCSGAPPSWLCKKPPGLPHLPNILPSPAAKHPARFLHKEIWCLSRNPERHRTPIHLHQHSGFPMISHGFPMFSHDFPWFFIVFVPPDLELLHLLGSTSTWLAGLRRCIRMAWPCGHSLDGRRQHGHWCATALEEECEECYPLVI